MEELVDLGGRNASDVGFVTVVGMFGKGLKIGIVIFCCLCCFETSLCIQYLVFPRRDDVTLSIISQEGLNLGLQVIIEFLHSTAKKHPLLPFLLRRSASNPLSFPNFDKNYLSNKT
jgi:hypothetical protein